MGINSGNMSLGLRKKLADGEFHGGPMYMIKHGINGLVCKCYDCEAMAENIENLIKYKKFYAKLSHNSYRRFRDELNAANMARKTYELYEKLYKKI